MSVFTFRPKERLKSRQQFLTVYRKGIRKESGHFKCALLRNDQSLRRLGLTVSKRVGNAVIRNRIKRLLREYFRLHKDNFPEASDIVITAKTGAAGLNYRDICHEMHGILQQVTMSSETGSHKRQ